MQQLIRTPYTAGSIRALHVIIDDASGGRGEAEGDEVLQECVISVQLLSAQCRCNEMITGVVDAFGIPWIKSHASLHPLSNTENTFPVMRGVTESRVSI